MFVWNAIDHLDDLADITGRFVDGRHGLLHRLHLPVALLRIALCGAREPAGLACALRGLSGLLRNLRDGSGKLLNRAGLLRRALRYRLAAGRNLLRARGDLIRRYADLAHDFAQRCGDAVDRLFERDKVAAVFRRNFNVKIFFGYFTEHAGDILDITADRVHACVQVVADAAEQLIDFPRIPIGRADRHIAEKSPSPTAPD
jgi:hypothetical protein